MNECLKVRILTVAERIAYETCDLIHQTQQCQQAKHEHCDTSSNSGIGKLQTDTTVKIT